LAFLTADAITLAPLVEEVSGSSRGGVVSFIGTVRDHHGGRAVTGLEYSAYPEMAEGIAAELLAEATSRWPVRATLRHRLGALTVGDTAVAVVVAGDHRDEAFAACRFLIEELKRRVPIWKKESYADGTVAWVDPTAESAGAHG
jgi:molybdopterin synthase catalytic subunit